MFVKSDFVNTILQQADALELVGPEFMWISGSSAAEDLVRLNYKMSRGKKCNVFQKRQIYAKLSNK